jgi:hypothetical protein
MKKPKLSRKILLLWIFLMGAVIVGSASRVYAVTISGDTNRPSTSTFALGERVVLTFNVSGLKPAQAGHLTVSFLDEIERPAGPTQTLAVRADGAGNVALKTDAPADHLGFYKVVAHLDDGVTLSRTGTRPEGFITYAVVPDPQRRIDYGPAGSRFGLQGGFNAHVDVLPYLGARYVLQGVAPTWAKAEPSRPGQYVGQSADRLGITTPLPVGSTWQVYPIAVLTNAAIPAWAKKPGTAGSVCSNFGALNAEGKERFSSFASQVAEVFSRKYPDTYPHYYQVTWEPANKWCYNGSADELVDFYKSSYDAIHSVDSSAVVVGPTLLLTNDSLPQLEALYSAGLGRYTDGLSTHPYNWSGGDAAAYKLETSNFLPLLRQEIGAARSAIGPNAVVIGTEHGFSSDAFGALGEAEGDIKTSVIMLGEGAKVDFGFYVHDFPDNDAAIGDAKSSNAYGFYYNLNTRIHFGSDKLGPKAVVPAFAAMTYFLDGKTSTGRLTSLSGTQMGYGFVGHGRRVDVIWDYGTTSSYYVEGEQEVCDWMGNCRPVNNSRVLLSNRPVYIISDARPTP